MPSPAEDAHVADGTGNKKLACVEPGSKAGLALLALEPNSTAYLAVESEEGSPPGHSNRYAPELSHSAVEEAQHTAHPEIEGENCEVQLPLESKEALEERQPYSDVEERPQEAGSSTFAYFQVQRSKLPQSGRPVYVDPSLEVMVSDPVY